MTYQELANEVKIVHHVIKKLTEKDEELKQMFCGTDIMFSPLDIDSKCKNKILLLGFNPGCGYYKEHGKIIEDFDEGKFFEYAKEEHILAKNFIDMLRTCNKEYLKNCIIKSNIYYFATENIDVFNKFMSKLNKYPEFQEVAKKILKKDTSGNFLNNLAKRWTKILIEEIVKPDIIICEGKGVYTNQLLQFIENDAYGIKINFDIKKIIYYERSYSNISESEKENFCKKLQELIK
jgi:hypothetical protein